MNIAKDSTVTFAIREDSTAEHRIHSVSIETSLTVERTTHDYFDCERDRTEYEWGVWDSRTSDWAETGYGLQDGKEFQTRDEAYAWVRENIATVLVFGAQR